MRLSALAAYARTLGCTAEEQVSMIDYTSFKIGGPADVYITAPTEAAAAASVGAVIYTSAGPPILNDV